MLSPTVPFRAYAAFSLLRQAETAWHYCCSTVEYLALNDDLRLSIDSIFDRSEDYIFLMKFYNKCHKKRKSPDQQAIYFFK
jgi:hypothetical protein